MISRFFVNNDILKIFVKSYLALVIVYAFMICCFGWGNHDWFFIKNEVNLDSHFFEGRYSLNVFLVSLFNGQVLPILISLFALAILVCLSFLSAKYLGIPEKYWLFISLFIGLNPHNFVVFYYLSLNFSFIMWAFVSCLGLYFCEKPYSVIKFLIGAFIYTLLLGSYPPIIVFVCVLFIARQLIKIEDEQRNFKDVFFNTLFLGGQFIAAFLGNRIINNVIVYNNDVSSSTYNMQMRSVFDFIMVLPQQLYASFSQFFTLYPFMGMEYCAILSGAVFVGCGLYIFSFHNKIVSVLGIIALFIASRLIFIIAVHADLAAYRIEYWGRLGLYFFAFYFLLKSNVKWQKNMVFLWQICVLILFIKTDFDIQKVWKLGFDSERMYHKRLVESVSSHPDFDMNGKYLSLSFGQPQFFQRFYDRSYGVSEGEILGNLTLPFDLINVLFWDDINNPIKMRSAVWGGLVWRLDEDKTRWTNTPENVLNMRYWMYMQAKVYPHNDFMFADDKYLIMNLDNKYFLQNRELVARRIDDYH